MGGACPLPSGVIKRARRLERFYALCCWCLCLRSTQACIMAFVPYLHQAGRGMQAETRLVALIDMF